MLRIASISLEVHEQKELLKVTDAELEAMADALRQNGRSGFRVMFSGEPNLFLLAAGRFKLFYRLKGAGIHWVSVTA